MTTAAPRAGAPGASGSVEHPVFGDRRFDHLPIHHGFAFASIESADMLDDPLALAEALSSLGMIEMPCVLVMSPRLREAVRAAGLEGMLRALVILPDDAAAAGLARRADIVIADTSVIADAYARAGAPIVSVGFDTIRADPYPGLVAAVPSPIARP